MTKHAPLSAAQFTALLLTSRLSQALLLTPEAVSGLNMTDRLLSILLNGVLVFVLLLPTLLVSRRAHGLLGGAYARSCSFGRGVGIAYELLCLFILCLDVVQFYDFAEKVMRSHLSVVLLTVALVVTALAAALYGIRSLARTGLLIGAFAVVCLLVFGMALVPTMRLWYFPPAPTAGVVAIVRAAVRDLPRTAEVVAVGLLYPYVGGAHTRAAAAFSGLIVLIDAAVSVTVLGTLGDFASLTAYPYYTAAAAAQLGVLQRMDILITAVWLSTCFVRTALFGTLLVDTARRLRGTCARIPTALFSAAALSAFAFFIRRRQEWQFLTGVYGAVLLAFCVLLPLLLFLLKRRARI